MTVCPHCNLLMMPDHHAHPCPAESTHPVDIMSAVLVDAAARHGFELADDFAAQLDRLYKICDEMVDA